MGAGVEIWRKVRNMNFCLNEGVLSISVQVYGGLDRNYSPFNQLFIVDQQMSSSIVVETTQLRSSVCDVPQRAVKGSEWICQSYL